ncbi:MAG: hypothetical protein GY712_10110, partial [Oceanicoccus sp.]|uniref:hypothetical protein n=1 Tax=Oceanicoccus sp. TaxID=2691044 RepID=UPI00262FC488
MRSFQMKHVHTIHTSSSRHSDRVDSEGSTCMLAHGVNHFVKHVRDVLLRGGRMTKVNGQVASYAPSFAGVISTGLAGLGAGLAGATGPVVGRMASRLAASTSAGALAVAMMAATPVVVTPVAVTIAGLGLVAGANPAFAGPDACTTAGTVITCTGDQSAGVSYTNPAYDTLNINNLTTAIAPALGDNGINFTVVGGNNITIDADTTGTTGITTTDTGADGIYGYVDGDGDVTITSTGDISTEGTNADGISGYVLGDGDVSITSTGDISTEGTNADGIYGYVYGNGDVTITSIGDISTEGSISDGIYVYVYGTGDVTITSTG